MTAAVSAASLPQSSRIKATRSLPAPSGFLQKNIDGIRNLCYHWYTPPWGGVLLEVLTPMMADQKTVLRLLKTARGQLDGIMKMVEEDRYCIDISQQVMATEAILNRVNKEILSAHLKNCVNQAQTPREREEKIDELISTLGKILK